MNLFLKADDGGGDVVERQLIETGKEPVTTRLSSLEQNREVVGIEDNWHSTGSLSLGLADLLSQAVDLAIRWVIREHPDDFPVPRNPVAFFELILQSLKLTL